MRCVTCGKDFETKPEERTLKVTTINPGDTFFSGQIVSCVHCRETYAEGEDVFKLAQAFDKAYEERHKR